MFIFKELGKSKSCEETPAVRRRRRQRRKAANDADVEMKRRSVYSKDFCRCVNLMLLVFSTKLCTGRGIWSDSEVWLALILAVPPSAQFCLGCWEIGING